MTIYLTQEDIVEEFFGCPYCGTARQEHDYRGCCGESSAHFCKMYVDENDEVYRENEIALVED